jgi:putative redox protein
MNIMKAKIDCSWKKGMAFEADVNGFKILLDADPAVGGENQGPRPKPLTLASLAGCTGMDVISILKKMRIEPVYFNISVEGELTEEHPKYYHKIHLVYELKGEGVDYDKVEKAVNLSQERFCGVSAMLRFGAEITHEIRILS